MSEVKIYNLAGQEKGKISLSNLFSKKVSDITIAKYVNYIRAAKRQAIANSKDRGEVSGGGKKPWKQKGTGHARVGSSRSPLWVHGGVTFGPTSDRNYQLKITKKSKSLSKQAILNHYFDQKQVKIIDKISLKQSKTKEADKIFSQLKLDGKIALFLSQKEIDLAPAFRNLPYVFLNTKNNIDILNIISCDWLVFSKDALCEVWPELKEADEKTS